MCLQSATQTQCPPHGSRVQTTSGRRQTTAASPSPVPNHVLKTAETDVPVGLRSQVKSSSEGWGGRVGGGNALGPRFPAPQAELCHPEHGHRTPPSPRSQDPMPARCGEQVSVPRAPLGAQPPLLLEGEQAACTVGQPPRSVASSRLGTLGDTH